MEKILSGHGSGGKLMNDMIDRTIRHILGPESIQLDDSAILDIPIDKIAFTADSFTITPIFFPGGNIGSLAVNGTVNDLAVMGAVPKYLSCSLIIEEGMEFEELKEILQSMKKEADSAGVKIVTGDTKVVPHGKCDKIFINTSGIGFFENKIQRREIIPGDKILINGTIGDHGMAIMGLRNNLSFTEGLKSDCAHLNHLIKEITDVFHGSIKFIRDATRGGAASVLNEIVKNKNFSAMLDEDTLPIRNEVKGISGILGIDPLYSANEGKIVIIAGKNEAEGILNIMKKNKLGTNAAIIGEINEILPGKAYLKTAVGGKRILPLLIEEQLPRIC